MPRGNPVTWSWSRWWRIDSWRGRPHTQQDSSVTPCAAAAICSYTAYESSRSVRACFGTRRFGRGLRQLALTQRCFIRSLRVPHEHCQYALGNERSLRKLARLERCELLVYLGEIIA